MGQNENKIEGVNEINNINNTEYCSCCFKILDKDMVKDIEENLFCDRQCRSSYWKENSRLLEEIVSRC